MKKYHLADALTAIEVIMAVILIGMTIYRAPPEWAIWVFVIGHTYNTKFSTLDSN